MHHDTKKHGASRKKYGEAKTKLLCLRDSSVPRTGSSVLIVEGLDPELGSRDLTYGANCVGIPGPVREEKKDVLSGGMFGRNMGYRGPRPGKWRGLSLNGATSPRGHPEAVTTRAKGGRSP